MVAVVLCLSGSALAASAPSAAEREAKEKFMQGRTAFDVGRFDEALKLYTEAYELKPLPALLFNIAQCHKQLGNPERALFFYRRFLSLAPPGTDVATVQGLIDAMEKLRDEQQKKKAEDDEAARRKAEDDARHEAELAAAKAETEAAVARALAERANETPPPEAPVPVYRRWYFWAGAGAVVVAIASGTAAAVVATAPQPKHTTLGTDSAR